MALQNIGAANSDDAFYRYKMPRMVTKIEGRGNGIKTNVVNMVDIAKALARPPSYTTKYFGCELGAQSKFDEKTGVSLVNGAHDTAKLAGLLENFIKKYVQCYGCGNPETEIIITKTQMITLKCAACGFLSDVDMRDKVTSFIIKNPPEQKKGSKDKKAMRRAEKERLNAGEAADEELKKLKKVTKKGIATTLPKKKASAGSDEDRSSPAGSQAGDNGAADEDDGVQWQTDTSLEAARQRIQEQLSAATAEMVMLSTDPDPSKDEKKEKSVVNNGISKAHEGVVPEPTKDEKKEKPVANNGTSKAPGGSVKEIKDYMDKGSVASELQSFMESLSLSPQDAMNSLIEALFEGVGRGFAKEAGKKKDYLAAAVKEEGSQMLLLRAIETFCGRSSACGDAVKEVALVAKFLYDGDVVEEESIVQWYKEGLAGANKSSLIWKNIKPLVEWLQSAESDSEDE